MACHDALQEAAQADRLEARRERLPLASIPAAPCDADDGLTLDRETAAGGFPRLDKVNLYPLRPNDLALKGWSAVATSRSVDGILDCFARLRSSEIRDLIAPLYDAAGHLAHTAPFGGPKALRSRSVAQEIH